MRGSRANCARYRAQMKRTDAPDPIPDEPTPEQLDELGMWVSRLTTAQRQRFNPSPDSQEPHEFSPAELPTLYLETTIVSYATARLSREAHIARNQRITRHWWRTFLPQHLSYSSEVVALEAGKGDPHAAARRKELLARLPSLHSTAQSDALAAHIFERCRLPDRAKLDAHHVAIAASNGLHVVVTWNCAHLANENMMPAVRRACEAYGYAAPRIYTSEQLIGVCAYG